MFRGGGSLLQTQHHKPPRHPAHHGHPRSLQPRHAHAHAHRRSSRWLAAAAVLLALVAAAALLYRRALLASPEQAGSEEEQRDSQAELALLHGQPSAAFCARPSPPLVCAHGGDVNAAPPNTAAAFAVALAGGARCVEVDVARTRDGQLAVLHPRELAHLLSLAGRAPRVARGSAHPSAAVQVGDFTWAELAALRWEGGERVEQAEDVVRRVLGSTDQITLDVKTYSQAGEELDEDVMAQEVVNLVRRTACRQCLVWAKSDAVVRLVKELLPGQPVGYVVMNETAAARAAGMHRLLRMPEAKVVALHFAMASQEVTARAHAARKEVHAWTANTAGMMRAVLDAAVDAVVTNHPQRLADAIQSRLQRCAGMHRQRQGQRGPEQDGQAANAAGAGASEDRSELRRLQQTAGQQQQKSGTEQARRGKGDRPP